MRLLARLLARMWWIPVTVTVAGIVYFGLVQLGRVQADWGHEPTGADQHRPFVPPPAPPKAEPVLAAEPPAPVIAPKRPPPPVLPGIDLPPFQPPKNPPPKK